MAFAADQTRLSTQSNARSGPVVRFIWHHQAGTSDDTTIGMMVSGSRQVSATWTVDNKAPVGGGVRSWARITAVVPEDRRPWTTASSLDDGAFTVECANSTGDPDWGISGESLEACARLAAYAYQARGVPLQRATAGNGWRGHMGHNEAPDTYATFCPGHLDIDYIIARGKQLVGDPNGLSGGALSEEDDVNDTQDTNLRKAADNSDMLLGRVIDLQNQLIHEVRPGIAFVQSQVGALAGIVAKLATAGPGGTVDQAALEAAAEKGAREALADLTLVAKDA